MKRSHYIIVLVLLITGSAKGFETSHGELSFDLGWGAQYDSNLLRYSKVDRDNYVEETETFKSPIRSLDDLRTDYKISAELRRKSKKSGTSSLRLTMDFAHHLMNPIKNLGWLSLSSRKDFSKTWILNSSYFFEPRFFIRDYTDSHTGRREHCTFTLHQLKASVTYRPKWLYDITGELKIKDYSYNEYFTEYDGELIGVGIETVYRPGGWRFSLGYGFESFKNSGFSSSSLLPTGTFLTDSEFGQGDYREDVFTGSARYSFILLRRKMDLQLSTEASRRGFTTNRTAEIDAMHSNREDIIFDISLTDQIALSDKLSLELGIGQASRDSDATAPIVSDLKDFQRTTAWIEISYELK